MMQRAARTRLIVFAVVTFAAFVITAVLSLVPAVTNLELASLNSRFRARGRLPLNDPDVVCVGISQQAVDELRSRWPWPRDYFARLVTNLNRAGARVVGLDVLFDVPAEGDSAFAAALRGAGNVVMAANIMAGERTIRQVVEPAPLLAGALSAGRNALGFINTEADPDAFHRRYLPFALVPRLGAAGVSDRQYNSFAVELVRSARFPDADPASVREKNGRVLVDTLALPLYDGRTVMVNYYGPALSFPYYHFDMVLDDSSFTTNMEREIGQPINSYYELVRDSVFAGKIVIVGAVLAELHDRFFTPFYDSRSIEMPGMEIHANAVQMMADGSFLAHPAAVWRWLIILALTAPVALAVARLKPGWAFLVSAALWGGYAAAVYLAFGRGDVVLDLVAPLTASLLTFAGTVLYDYVGAQKEKRRITGMFQQYVPPDVVKQIVADPDALNLQGEKRVLSALFTDIEGFTHISEGRDPQELVSLLREYLSVMTDVVIRNGGIIDKYEGDALVAEFGIPIAVPDHAYRACAAALGMQEELFDLNERWRDEDKPRFRTRIGVSTGEMVFGNLGSRQVFDYTVLGDAVNLGARLESANKYYGTRILISGETYRQAHPRILARELDLIRVQGKERPERIYHLIALDDDPQAGDIARFIGAFEHGLGLYRGRAWDESIAAFEQVVAQWGNDLATLAFIERCREYRDNPPVDAWDGVWRLAGK